MSAVVTAADPEAARTRVPLVSVLRRLAPAVTAAAVLAAAMLLSAGAPVAVGRLASAGSAEALPAAGPTWVPGGADSRAADAEPADDGPEDSGGTGD